MIADVVRAEGAPGPTLVLDQGGLPRGALALRGELTALRRWLEETGRGRIHKIALVGRSPVASYDVDYRFVQCLPEPDGFDFRAGCGHSLLAAVVASGRRGPVRVRAVTTGDPVLCLPRPDGSYTVRLERAVPTAALLPTGRPVQRLCGLPVSLVRYGNPYVFVAARDLGLSSRDALFGAGAEVLARLLAVRAAAARLLGLPAGGALPKVAAVGASLPGRLTARAATVAGWHPGLALTGGLCLAAAREVPGTVPWLLSEGPHRRPWAAGDRERPLRLDTPSGPMLVSAAGSGRRLAHVAVHGKRARVLERSLPLPWRIHVTA
ncbi:2-methylaconitate cis-trans isomerase PrpF family protein [Streptomyces misionensis]|uniref:hypothetical protein n=1 Tax=Streptomyces misionensis TaxID=67331 RepID=UPI003702958C